MNNFYQHSLPQPYHISVGGVLFNDNHEICVHHFFKKDIPEAVHFLMDFQDDIYHLMRESLEGNEPLQDAVVRGMKEEFGIESKSMMEWHSPNELLKIFSEQCKKTGRPELDERVIIERFKNAYGIK